MGKGVARPSHLWESGVLAWKILENIGVIWCVLGYKYAF